MTTAQGYQSKAAEIERLARDPCLPPELRTELRIVARQWRHRAAVADWTERQLGVFHAPLL
jgi:hypothetical protein